jgi:hypothetical protein
LVEYSLLLAGVTLVCVVAVSMLGHKTADMIGVMAAVLPGAHADDNKPIQSIDLIPLDKTGTEIQLNVGLLVSSGGTDRMTDLLGPGGGALLVID